MIARLEGYYLGNGHSWDGVQTIISEHADTSPRFNFWKWTYLTDKNGKVILSLDNQNDGMTGKNYQPQRDDIALDLVVNGEVVGKVVYEAISVFTRIRLIVTFLLPVGIISVFLAVFLIISDYYLVRQIIFPLSNTIAAAKQVTSGNLKARVDLSGPVDLIVLNKTFNNMIEHLDESNTKRQEFLADIAHELRTPLTIMRGRLEGIVDNVYPADEAHIAPILQETYLLERLVEDLRTLTLAETRQLHFDPKKIDLESSIRSIVDVFSSQADSQNTIIEVLPAIATIFVMTDPQRLEQIIGNILYNSLHYIKQDGKIRIELQPDNDQAVISISDNGPGVPEEYLPYLFDRFWRKEKSRSRSTGGSGLGLAIVRQLVEAQNGSISAGKPASGGLIIRVTLPIVQSPGV